MSTLWALLTGRIRRSESAQPRNSGTIFVKEGSLCLTLNRGGDHAEVECTCCICPARPGANARSDHCSNFNHLCGGHFGAGDAGRSPTTPVVRQVPWTWAHQLHVPHAGTMPGIDKRKRRHLLSQAYVDCQFTTGMLTDAGLVAESGRVFHTALRSTASVPPRYAPRPTRCAAERQA